ncbi:Sulfotransferase 1E1 [Pseudolycoriella hygida]|uniref:Sulfotransferase 1E1 n=1 Tax=Pseudolycoriella hygida TaxID=35572 RepID=A0A9Q0S8Y8_9DIPT|nr:Sulfotransferase 1E1 [Pseudolycoriella hygida]
MGHKTSSALQIYKKLPFQIDRVDEVTEKRILSHFKGPLTGTLQVGPDKWMMPKCYLECAEKLYNVEARTDDIYLCTFPRSGTTWTQEMLWLLCNNLDYETAKSENIFVRSPFLEFESFVTGGLKDCNKELTPPAALDLLPQMTCQRVIKTHLPMKLLPHDALSKGCKIVYVARNPKDVVVSLFHFLKNPRFLYEGDFDQFVDLFMDDLLTWSPYFEHVKDGWRHRNDPNVLFLFYEDLVMNLKGSLTSLATFVGHSLNEENIPQLMEHLHIENFKENPTINQKNLAKYGSGKWVHVRRGRIGGNPEMTLEIEGRIDEKIEKHFAGTGLKFPYQ